MRGKAQKSGDSGEGKLLKMGGIQKSRHFPQIQLQYPLPKSGHLDILVKSPQARVKRRNGEKRSRSFENFKVAC